jgi:hypothetical protein
MFMIGLVSEENRGKGSTVGAGAEIIHWVAEKGHRANLKVFQTADENGFYN